MVEDAQALFEAKDYVKAYDAYDKLNAKYPKDFDFKFKLGLCCLKFTEKKARAVEVFEGIKLR
ncbi:MAG: tetratricopeptide repeat protein [Sphingobacteriaceae bacterium]|nr:tetratricopeptide repeat protein [Sphingobacteriaceae bacterium]